MYILFECRCGHEFRARAENVGMQIACPNCMTRVTVPNQASESRDTAEIPSSEPEFEVRLPIERKTAERQSQSNSAGGSSSKRPRPGSAATSSHSPTKRRNSSKLPMIDDDLIELSDIEEIEAPSDEIEVLQDLPVRQRKKKQKKDKKAAQSQKPRSKALLLILASVIAFSTFAVIGFFAFPALVSAMKEGGKITAPQEFAKFEDLDIQFRCQVPVGWDVDSRGGSGNIPPSVRIEKGRVKIVYRASNMGAAIQDTSQAFANKARGELPDELKPVAIVHETLRKKFSTEMANYQEIGGPEKIATGWGDGRISEFTASGDFGRRIFGYRITLLTTQHQYNVICQCPTKREFDAYKNMFRKIIESTGR